jgi:FixJ family two-component response regulator
MSDGPKPLISIVDDDESVREATEALMQISGFRAQSFTSAAEFLLSPALKSTACLITDFNMPTMTGLELFRRLAGIGHRIPTIMITAYPDDEIRLRSLAGGVICYLTKPFDDNILLDCVRKALVSTPRYPPD